MVSLDCPPPWPPGVVTWLLLLIFGTWQGRGEAQLAHVISEGVTAPGLATDLLYHPHWSWEAGQRKPCGVVIKIIVAHCSVLSAQYQNYQTTTLSLSTVLFAFSSYQLPDLSASPWSSLAPEPQYWSPGLESEAAQRSSSHQTGLHWHCLTE